MARRFAGRRLVVATHNRGKVRELQVLLAPFGFELVSAGELGLPVPAETGTTFVENATIKALAAAKATGEVALADDSGLCVAALGGAPGVYSADWAVKGDFKPAMERVWREMAGATDRRATFVSVLALAWPDGHVESVEGTADGEIVWPPRGTNGFGYNPIFQPVGHDRTYAEMPDVNGTSNKNAISHRAEALRKLVAACFAK